MEMTLNNLNKIKRSSTIKCDNFPIINIFDIKY